MGYRSAKALRAPTPDFFNKLRRLTVPNPSRFSFHTRRGTYEFYQHDTAGRCGGGVEVLRTLRRTMAAATGSGCCALRTLPRATGGIAADRARPHGTEFAADRLSAGCG